MKIDAKVVWIIFLLLPNDLVAQTFDLDRGGINLGLSFNIGSTTQRLGGYAGAFYASDYIQINSTVRLYYNFRTFGPSLKGWELQPSIGILGTFGDMKEQRDDFFYALGNQTGRKYCLGYSYNFYVDQVKTTQRTGTILIGLDKVEVVTENDIFAVARSDRYRTGAIRLSYKNGDFLCSITSILWTGNPQSPKTVKVRNSDYPSRFGYLDLSDAPYGKFSNGILAFQMKYNLGYGQEVQGSIGIDSEHVRNIFQNKAIHDMYLWPKKWNKAKNSHLPMLTDDGSPYVYRNDQKLKPSSFYFDISLNPSTFY